MNSYHSAKHAAALAVLLLSTTAGAALANNADDDVTYQINVAHTGSVSSPNLYPPYAKLWSRDLGAKVSYPLIADGKVFVTVGDNSVSTVQLYALDAATGGTAWGPVSVKGTYWWANAAFDNHAVFVVNDSGLVTGFNAANGAVLWSKQLDQYSFNAPPAASNGVLYVGGAGSGGTLYAIDESNGHVTWSTPVMNGDSSGPTLSNDGVFVSYAGPQVYKLDPSTGAPLWHYDSGIEGGGGSTPVYYDGDLYCRVFYQSGSNYFNGMIFSGASKNPIGSFAPGYTSDPLIPAFDGTTAFLSENGSVTSYSLGFQTAGWTFSRSNEYLNTAPIVVNGYVFAASILGDIYAVDESTGVSAWNDQLGAGTWGPDEADYSQPLTGLGAGDGLLVVPANHLLVAYTGIAPVAAVGLNPVKVLGGHSAKGTVTLIAAAPAGGEVVDLSSSDTTAATVPATVTVPAGAATAAFPIKTYGVQHTSGVTVTASTGDWTAQANMTVTFQIFRISFSPANVTGGHSTTGTVTLSAPAPVNQTIDFKSSNPAVAPAPSPIVIPAGQTQGTFKIITARVTSPANVSIEAYGAGHLTQTLTVSP